MFTLAPPLSPPAVPLLLFSLPKPHPSPNPQSSLLLLLRRRHQQPPPLTLATNASKFNTTSLSTSTSTSTSTADADEDEFWEEEEEEEKGDGEEEDEFLAFEDMRKWEMNRPAGFGEGKVYDTTVEESILEEMKTESQLPDDKIQPKTDSKQLEPQHKALEAPRGPCVRLGNLPKKKNIHRDLQAAFKGFSGIVNISPSVSGNRKTRDPICKGFAFIEFTSEEAANRFARTYSKQNILFGKVQKQVSCEVINHGQVDDDTREKVNIMGNESFYNKPIRLRSVDDTKEESSNINKGRELCIEHPNISPSSDEDISLVNIANKGLDNSMLPTQKQKKVSNKKVVKTKQQKSPKSTLSSSMARLKIKERSVLTGVFSKYGVKVASASD
ncbi:uncharacterized protein M6B38_376105 [Iris pallida]|uniref:RRM domain-containing protein n=1 Tax=Iris pallida TaxID=29817 RepID=A0AAX6G9T0_IRIPA|nr:uncharacterized protein M6B38_376105 [Iris pallida]